jgi:hypothetical protein
MIVEIYALDGKWHLAKTRDCAFPSNSHNSHNSHNSNFNSHLHDYSWVHLRCLNRETLLVKEEAPHKMEFDAALRNLTNLCPVCFGFKTVIEMCSK